MRDEGQLPVPLDEMLDELVDLCAVHRRIQGLSDEGVVTVASAAAHATSDCWLAQARAIGELQRRAEYRSAAVAEHAKRLGIGRSTAFQLGSIDRQILLPRLTEHGDAAKFPIRSKLFYVKACELAADTHLSPIAILEIAERERAKDRRFSTRKLFAHLGVQSIGRRPGPRIDKCLATLAGLQRKDRQRYARAVENPEEVIRLARQTAENARLLAEDLRAELGESE